MFSRDRQALLAALLFVLLPESAFFGRMLNHEVLVLPAALLIVRYGVAGRTARQALAGGGRPGLRVGGAGRLGRFFVMAACALHAAWELAGRRNARAQVPLLVLALLAPLLFAADLAHLAWVQEGGLGHLRELAVSRIGVAGDRGAVGWVGRVLELHWRYFGLTSMAALGLLAWRGGRGQRAGPRDPALDVGLIWLAAGAGYVACFSLNAAVHDYWQFLLLPASAIGIVLAHERLSALAVQSRQVLYSAVVAVAAVEILVPRASP